jgi:hypothetical protein
MSILHEQKSQNSEDFEYVYIPEYSCRSNEKKIELISHLRSFCMVIDIDTILKFFNDEKVVRVGRSLPGAVLVQRKPTKAERPGRQLYGNSEYALPYQDPENVSGNDTQGW